MTGSSTIPFVPVSCEGAGASTRPNELGMRPMQERAWEGRGEQCLPVKSPPASGKGRAPMFIALDKLRNQGLKQAIIAAPERTVGASLADARPAEAAGSGRTGQCGRGGTCATRPAATTAARRAR